jgi:hypothetical protein
MAQLLEHRLSFLELFGRCQLYLKCLIQLEVHFAIAVTEETVPTVVTAVRVLAGFKSVLTEVFKVPRAVISVN